MTTEIKPLDSHQLATRQSAILRLESLHSDLRMTGNKEAASALGDSIEGLLSNLDCAKCETCQSVKLAAALAHGVCARCLLLAQEEIDERAEQRVNDIRWRA